ncbi:MAG: PHP domain-containing protein [Ruminococcaceae bacterium]|nr:PHP domain-containing protein [Oscillospiraceae bacterium]
MSQYPRGSEWHRWDLHIHSNASDGKATPQQIIAKAKEQGLSVIAITDHHTVRNVDEIKRLGLENGIHVISGVEFRTEYGEKSVHIIGLFPDTVGKITLDQKALHDLVLSPLNLSETLIIAKGKEQDASLTDEKAFKKGMFEVQVDFKQAAQLIRKYGGIVTVHAGGKTSGIDEEIKHQGNGVRNVKNLADSLGPLKTELLSSHVDICEVKSLDSKNIDFYWNTFKRVSIIASDAHKLDEIGSEYVWIKADPNFKGLKQAVIEPDRIFVGEIPPSLNRIHNNKTKTIESVNIDWSDSYTGNRGEWFKDIKIPLNPEMTVIIGNKGSGKTAIAEIIGLLSNSKNESDFAFLEKRKFREKSLSKNFDATINWYDSVHTVSKNLGEHIDTNAVELVHCVPQNSFEKFCNDNSDDSFKKEINSVVFSRMKKEDKLSFRTFEDLIHNEKSSTSSRRKDIEITIDTLNDKIKHLEEKRDFDYKKSLESTLSTLKRELEEHNKNKPSEVKPPEGLVTEEYVKNVSDLKTIQNEIDKTQGSLEIATKHKSNITIIRKDFENLKTSLDDKLNLFKGSLLDYQLDLEKIFKYNFDLSSIDVEYDKYNKQVQDLQGLLSETESIESQVDSTDTTKSLTLIDKKKLLETTIEQFNTENQGKLTQYQKYLTDSKSWEDKNKELSQQAEDLKTQIEYIGDCKTSQLVIDIKELKGERLEKVKQIYKCLTDEQALYNKFKEPIVEFLEEYQVDLQDFKAEINTGIYPLEDFINTFVDKYISNNVSGPFKGADGEKKIKEYFAQYDFSTEEGLVCFINCIDEEFGKFCETKCYHSMFKKNMYDTFVSDFYKLTYLDARYSLQLFGKELSSLSPGERGSLLLVFYLLLDARDIPLILDQPEDNLDNESVAKILVPFIREAKKRRQIIIVTHNSNLAVVSDAEQVIRVKIDKLNNYKFSYESGSLESEIINDVVDVLEGTINSFNIRKDKYLN